MIRFALIFTFSLAAIICQAQEHLRFMDILIDGNLDSFCSKLIQEKGLVAGTMTDREQYMSMETKKLIGNFYGIKDCTFFVRRHKLLNNVSSVIVEDTLKALGKSDEARLISLLDKNYGNHKTDSLGYSVWYTWKTTSGDVELAVQKEGFIIFYTDYTENDISKQIWFFCNLVEKNDSLSAISIAIYSI